MFYKIIEKLHKESTYKSDYFNFKSKSLKEIMGINKPDLKDLSITEERYNEIKPLVTFLSEEEKVELLKTFENNSSNKDNDIKISGYQGYIESVKSENIYGKTFNDCYKNSKEIKKELFTTKENTFVNNYNKPVRKIITKLN